MNLLIFADAAEQSIGMETFLIVGCSLLAAIISTLITWGGFSIRERRRLKRDTLLQVYEDIETLLTKASTLRHAAWLSNQNQDNFIIDSKTDEKTITWWNSEGVVQLRNDFVLANSRVLAHRMRIELVFSETKSASLSRCLKELSDKMAAFADINNDIEIDFDCELEVAQNEVRRLHYGTNRNNVSCQGGPTAVAVRRVVRALARAPAGSSDQLVERLADSQELPDGSSHITGNDQSNRKNSMTVSKEHMKSPFYIEIRWKSKKDESPYLVGKYSLDLAQLLDQQYVREESSGRIRLIIVHNGDDFIIQLNKESPSLKLPR